MKTRRRPAAEASTSLRSIAYLTGASGVDLIFNLIRPVLSVCPLSAVVVQIVGWESVVILSGWSPDTLLCPQAFVRAGTCIPEGYQLVSS